MRRIEKIHNEAMELLDKAHIAKINKNIKLYNQYMKQAFEKEKKAANQLLYENIEPSRSILFRSAATIAYNIGFFDEAEKLAYSGLIGSPPEWAADELREICENCRNRNNQ